MVSGRRGLGPRFDPESRAEGLFREPRVAYAATTVATHDGAQLHVRSYGSAFGQPIVLIHGFGCRIEYWNPQILPDVTKSVTQLRWPPGFLPRRTWLNGTPRSSARSRRKPSTRSPITLRAISVVPPPMLAI